MPIILKNSLRSKTESWGIVGGGLLGMTLAHRLAQQGRRVTLLEAEAQLGGLASAWQIGVITWDRFYHVILLSDAHTRSLLREIDVERDIKWVETKTGFYADGTLHSMSNTFEFLRFPP
ncbi:FAD-dependent oxidoreductase, partial [candidate division KSB1 bacterium]